MNHLLGCLGFIAVFAVMGVVAKLFGVAGLIGVAVILLFVGKLLREDLL